MPSLTTYKLLKQEHNARRGEFKTVHGTVQTPAFQNVATAGAIKGGLSAHDLKDIGAQVMLCNTYHLHLRPGDKLVAEMGGLHKFTRWNGPILTDSGGFQVFSLAKLRKITEEGVTFASHLDGHRIFMGPEESMQIQANLGSTIAMAFDECVENPAQHDYSKASCERTTPGRKRPKLIPPSAAATAADKIRLPMPGFSGGKRRRPYPAAAASRASPPQNRMV